ncbi:MAG: phospho-sugar mutase, partial [Armatimonadetes bacterium]|nr:phospho-sugar mutase [Armatimonadota bacterium]
MSANPLPAHLEDAAERCKPHLSGVALRRLRRWLGDEPYSPYVPTIEALVRAGKWAELADSFRTVLPFGTGGRRGPRGIGPNRINARTIAESARGLVNWTRRRRRQAGLEHSVVIAYDTRIASEELARVCAEVVAACGMKALLFAECRPTPQLSFAVRQYRAEAGIVISASHNPPSDNGFKAYGHDGGQVAPPHDGAVMEAVKRLSGKPIPQMPFDEALAAGRIVLLGGDADDAYRSAVVACGLAPNRNVDIVYTPLSGTGMYSVVPVLQQAGFEPPSIVKSQEQPDGTFSAVTGEKPNPEEPAALDRAGMQAEREHADIAIGTDPDADRLGCIAIMRGSPSGPAQEWKALTGNQIGAILCSHVLAARREAGRLDARSLVVTTSVTSRLIGKIAASYRIGCIEELLVGFKYVASVIESLDDPNRLVFACEESHGYLGGPYTRDKDAACAALFIAEAAALAKDRNADLFSTLDGLYALHGYHRDIMFSEELSPAGGKARIRRMTNGLRAEPPVRIGGLPVLRITDRLTATVRAGASAPPHALPPIADPATGVAIASLEVARDNLL